MHVVFPRRLKITILPKNKKTLAALAWIAQSQESQKTGIAKGEGDRALRFSKFSPGDATTRADGGIGWTDAIPKRATSVDRIIVERAPANYTAHMSIHTGITVLPPSVLLAVRVLTPDPVIALQIHQPLATLLVQRPRRR